VWISIVVAIFDVDDTALSNYTAMRRHTFKQIPKLDGGWVRERKAPAIPETRLFYQYMVARGFIVMFLSGRRHDEHEDTVANLKAQGFKVFDRLVVRPKGSDNCPAGLFKAEARKVIAEEGFEIVGCIGDQQSDFCGGNTGFEIKLPNYLYEMA
jgi:predicted secreted acid phosphatase